MLDSRARGDRGGRETGVGCAQRRRLESRGRGDSGWSPGKAEMAAGSPGTRSWRLEPGGRGDCGWSPRGRGENSYILEGTETPSGRSRQEGRSKADRPVTPHPGLPQPGRLFLSGWGTPESKIGVGGALDPESPGSQPVEPRGRPAGATRHVPGSPGMRAARGPLRPCTARAQTEPRGREPGLWELMSRPGPIFQ